MTKLINSFFIYATSQNLIIFSQNNFKFFLSLGLIDFMFPSNSENIICLSKKEKYPNAKWDLPNWIQKEEVA